MDYARHARREHFTGLASTNSKLQRYRELLPSATEATAGLPADEQEAAGKYLTETGSIIDDLDPIASPDLILPEAPDPTPEQIKPFLSNGSPYGAEP